jgi:hypothetical protein
MINFPIVLSPPRVHPRPDARARRANAGTFPGRSIHRAIRTFRQQQLDEIAPILPRDARDERHLTRAITVAQTGLHLARFILSRRDVHLASRGHGHGHRVSRARVLRSGGASLARERAGERACARRVRRGVRRRVEARAGVRRSRAIDANTIVKRRESVPPLESRLVDCPARIVERASRRHSAARDAARRLDRDGASTRAPARVMTLWTLTQSALLAANAVAILNEPRFLAKRGLTARDVRDGAVAPASAKGQIIGVINAATYLRVPLIALNAIVVFVKVVFG